MHIHRFGLCALLVIYGSEISYAAPAESLRPSNIYFPVPSMAQFDEKLELQSIPPSAQELIIAAEDWCQMEFFTRSNESQLDTLLQRIRLESAANRTNFGWTKVFIRKFPAKRPFLLV